MFSASNQRTTALRLHKILLVGEIWEKLEVCSVIQTREPLLYDSIKILLVNENIVELEVCSVILHSRITALRLQEDGKDRIMECVQ